MSQWAEIRHLHLVEKLLKKEIARRLKLDVKTVRRAIVRPTPPVRVSPPRPGAAFTHTCLRRLRFAPVRFKNLLVPPGCFSIARGAKRH